MSPEALEELASSIRAQGIIQPIVVLQTGEEQFEIIAGERRWRAHKLLGRDTIDARITDETDPAKLYALQIVENLQRANLTTSETANGVTAMVNLPGPDGTPIGVNAADAVKAAVMCEDAARTVHIARQAGELVPIPQDKIDSLFNRYQNVYGQSSDDRR